MDIFNSWLVKTPIAHRGLHNDDLPENSLGAFENAIKHKYPFELDVRIIDDGTIVVFHDDLLPRMTGKDGYVGNLKKEDLSGHKLLKTEYSIPTFQELLEVTAGQVPMLIEIKNNAKVGLLEKAVIDALKNYKGEYAIQSFNPYSLQYFKENAPNMLRGQLSCFYRGEKSISFIKKYILKRLKLNNISCPNFIAYNYGDLPNRYVSKYSDLPLLAWTIRSDQIYETVKKHCNNIIFEKFEPLL